MEQLIILGFIVPSYEHWNEDFFELLNLDEKIKKLVDFYYMSFIHTISIFSISFLVLIAANSSAHLIPFANWTAHHLTCDQTVISLAHFDASHGVASIHDQSNRTFTNVGSPQISTTQSKFGGSSLYLNGSSSVKIYDNVLQNLGAGDFTIDFWYYPTVGTSSKGPFVYGNHATETSFGSSNGNGLYKCASGGACDSYAALTYTLNTWNHVVLQRTAGNVSMFLNGSRLAQQSIPDIFNTSCGVFLGSGEGSSECVADHFITGYIDEFRFVKGSAVYPDVSTLAVPSTEFNCEAYDPLWASVTAYLPFDGTSGTTAITDVKGNTVTASGNTVINNTTKKFSEYVFFDGTGDFITLPNSSGFSIVGSPLTIETWIYLPSHVARIRTIATKRPGAGSEEYFFYVTATGGLQFTAWGSSTVRLSIVSTSNVPIGVWTHVAVVSDGNGAKIFMNGIEEASGTYSGALGTTTQALHIGRDPTNAARDFYGYMDDFRITRSTTARYTTSTLLLPYKAFPTK